MQLSWWAILILWPEFTKPVLKVWVIYGLKAYAGMHKGPDGFDIKAWLVQWCEWWNPTRVGFVLPNAARIYTAR